MTLSAPSRPLEWLPRCTLATSLALVVLGVVALTGWAVGIEQFKRVYPGGVPMNPLTALAIVALGVALACVAREHRAGHRSIGARYGRIGLGAFVALIGTLKLGEWILDWELGIDRLLVAPDIPVPPIAPNTAACCVLSGLALALDFDERRRYRLDQILALATAFIAFLAILGYAYGITSLYGIAPTIPMAFNTAIGFALFGGGLLAANPGRGLMRFVTSPGPGGVLVRRLLPATVLIPALLGWCCLVGRHAQLFDTDSGFVLFAVSNMVVFAVGVLATAEMLNRAELRRKQAEASLQHEQHLLRQLMDHLPDSIFFKDHASRFMRINQALARRLGLNDPAAAVGKTDFDFFTEEHARPAYEDEQEVLRVGAPLSGKEEKETWSDGRQRWVLTSRLPLRDAAGALIGTFGIARDITDRKRAEEVLRQAEAEQRMLLESTGEGIYGIDVQGNCTFINPAAAAMLGYHPDELRGHGMHAQIHHHHPDGTPYAVEECPIYQTLRTGESCRVEKDVFWRKDGSPIPVDYASAPIRTEAKGIRGAVVTFTDNTERDRMRSLLMQSEKLASIGLLSAGIAHEINNPLAYVANNLAVLHRDFKGVMEIMDAYEGTRSTLAAAAPESARQIATLSEDLDLAYVRDNLERVLTRTREGVQRVTNIVQGLRSLARTDRPQMEDAHLPELVEMGLELIRERLRRRGIAVEQAYGPGLKLRCVPTQIGQVLLNLLTNAMQAIESCGKGPGGRIRVRGQVIGPELHIEVEDNGGGIDAKDLERIFDPFFTTKPVGEGTGLGLAITHGIVTGHGGRIEVQSQPGEGTCFRVVFPVNRAGSRTLDGQNRGVAP